MFRSTLFATLFIAAANLVLAIPSPRDGTVPTPVSGTGGLCGNNPTFPPCAQLNPGLRCCIVYPDVGVCLPECPICTLPPTPSAIAE